MSEAPRTPSGRSPVRPPEISAAAETAGMREGGGGRDDPRDYVRQRPAQPHEKFEIATSRMSRGMDYFWASIKIPFSNLRNPRLDTYRRAGWRFARAEDFPEHSGYQPEAQVNNRFIELGIDREVRADDPVIIDNASVLMMRPKEMSAEARSEQERAAKAQIEDYMATLRRQSERQIGKERTTLRRNVGPTDEAMSDAEAEV